jgi:hypothetical protein
VQQLIGYSTTDQHSKPHQASCTACAHISTIT